MTNDNFPGVLAQIAEYRRMFKNNHYPVRHKVENGVIYDERHTVDSFGNPVVMRAMRIMQPHSAFKEV
jgi:hypothetical protein